MNRRSFQVVQSFLCCLSLALLAACNAGDFTPPVNNSSTVVLTISAGTTAQAAPAIEKAAPVVATLRFTISASDMTSITKEIPFTLPGTVEEFFDVPNGTDRVFLVEALDASGIVVYAGSSTADLDGNPNGQPVELVINMVQQFLSGNPTVSTPWTDIGAAIGRDSSGNLIVVGSTFGDVDGYPNADTYHGTSDVFITKFTKTGEKLWSRQFGTSKTDVASGVAVDTGDNIFVVGSTMGDLNKEPNANPGLTPDAFVVKFDASGSLLWTKLVGTTDVDIVKGCAVDAAGNVYVTGKTNGGLGSFTNAGSSDVFVAEFDPNGKLVALDQMGTPYNDSGDAITVDASGNINVAGSTYGDLEGNTNAAGTPGASSDFFLTRYTSAAQLVRQWTVQMGSSRSDEAAGIVSDSTGSIYLTGSTSGSLDGNTNGNPGGVSPDVFVTKFDGNGVKLWTAQFGTNGADIGQGIAYDPSGFLYVAGNTNGSLDGNANAGDNDIFLARFDTDGNKIWTRQVGTAYKDIGTGVVADNYGNAFVVGGAWMSSSLDAVIMPFTMNGMQW